MRRESQILPNGRVEVDTLLFNQSHQQRRRQQLGDAPNPELCLRCCVDHRVQVGKAESLTPDNALTDAHGDREPRESLALHEPAHENASAIDLSDEGSVRHESDRRLRGASDAHAAHDSDTETALQCSLMHIGLPRMNRSRA
jgi:hypothetical protein